LRERDAERRKRLQMIIASEELTEAEDYYIAAWLLNHGETVAEIWQAHTLAKKAAELGLRRARWLAAATFDRWLMYQGKPQKYGTQLVPDGKRQRVWDVDPTTSDIERAEWDVPSLAEMEKHLARLVGFRETPRFFRHSPAHRMPISLQTFRTRATWVRSATGSFRRAALSETAT